MMSPWLSEASWNLVDLDFDPQLLDFIAAIDDVHHVLQ